VAETQSGFGNWKKTCKKVWKRSRYVIKCLRQKGKPVASDYHPALGIHLFYWKYSQSTKNPLLQQTENLGDYLSEVVVSHFAPKDKKPKKNKKKTLYAVGSILGMRCQDAVVWGSGLINTQELRLVNNKIASLDICAVRGPKTREELLKIGKKCPPVCGDPAILMPFIFMPQVTQKKYKVTLIPHYVDTITLIPTSSDMHTLHILTKDYQDFITQICQSELVISSSLHGIILAETYGVPAVLLLPEGRNTFKYEDWYYSTGRYDITIARSVEEALSVKPMALPDLSKMQKDLVAAFPAYLWD
jgi:pyruvyltransferase